MKILIPYLPLCFRYCVIESNNVATDQKLGKCFCINNVWKNKEKKID